MSRIEDKLAEMGFEMPQPDLPTTPRLSSGWIDCMSGHGAGLPDLPGGRTKGWVGENISIEEGYATARAVILMIVASLKQFTGDLDHLK